MNVKYFFFFVLFTIQSLNIPFVLFWTVPPHVVACYFVIMIGYPSSSCCGSYICSIDAVSTLLLLLFKALNTSLVYPIMQRLWKGHGSVVGPWQPVSPADIHKISLCIKVMWATEQSF